MPPYDDGYGTIPASADSSPSSGFSFGGLVDSIASGFGQGLASRAIGSGRAPGFEQFANPIATPTGSAGQPNTTPAVNPSAGQLLPGVSNTTLALVVAGGIAVIAGLVLVLRK